MKTARILTTILLCSTLTLIGATLGCEREEPAAPPQSPEQTEQPRQWPEPQRQMPERDAPQQDDSQSTPQQEDGQY